MDIYKEVEPLSLNRDTQNMSHRFTLILMVLVVGILLLGGILIGRFRLSSSSINTAKLGLDSMKDISPNKIDGVKDSTGRTTYQASSYAELQETLGIHLLDGNLVNHDVAVIEGRTDNRDYHDIKIEPFIDTEKYSLSMNISIKCSANQKEEGLLPEFLGEFEIKGDFISSQGYHVVVIGGKKEVYPDGTQSPDGVLTAVFVADGILYQLSGKVSVGELKQIIQSLS